MARTPAHVDGPGSPVLRADSRPAGGWVVAAACATLAAACGRAPAEKSVPDGVASTADTAPLSPPAAASPATDSAPPPASDSSDTAAAAAGVIRRYYDAIARRDYPAAYALWSDGGRSSGQTLDAFTRGYADTDTASVQLGTPGPIEGAAGSRYVEIPVEIRARTRAGATQRFTGSYVLRRAVVDGATAEQRSWRIASARLRAAP